MDKVKKYSLIFVLLLVSIGVIVLLPHQPSFWGDELLGGVSFTGASSVREFLSVQWSIGTEVAPIYPLLLYFNDKYIHIPQEMFRYFSALCCVLSVLFIYLTMTKLSDRKTAFFVALVVALLPLHLWYSMLLRPHALAFLLSIVSFYFFSLVERGNSLKYFLPLCFINTALIFTHYIFFWIPFAECLFLVLNKKFCKQSAVFILFNFIIMVGVIFYLGIIVRTNNIDFVPEKSFKQLIFTIFGLMDFEISSINSWAIYIQPLFFIRKPIPIWLNSLLRTAPLVIIYMGNILLSILFLYILIKKLLTIIKDKSISTDITFYLLFFGIILPILFVLLQIISGTNILMARYFYLSWICKIALLFICVGEMGNKRVRYLLTIVIFLFFFHHYILYRSCTPYSDWNSCVKHIQDQTKKDEIIITGRFEEALILKYVSPALETIPIIYSTSIKSALDYVSALQNKHSDLTIWLVYSMQWNPNIPCILREELKKRKIIYSEKVFPAFEGIACYKIQPKIVENNNAFSSHDAFYQCNTEYNWEEEKNIRKGKMRAILEKSVKPSNNIEPLLDWFVFPDGTAGVNTIPQLIFQIIAKGKGNEALSLCEHFSEQTHWATIGLIFSLTERGEIEKAEQVFYKLTQKNFYLAKLLKPLWKDYVEKKYEELSQQCKQLKKAGFPLAHLLGTVVQLRKKDEGQQILQSGLFPFNEEAEKQIQDYMSDLSDTSDRSDSRTCPKSAT